PDLGRAQAHLGQADGAPGRPGPPPDARRPGAGHEVRGRDRRPLAEGLLEPPSGRPSPGSSGPGRGETARPDRPRCRRCRARRRNSSVDTAKKQRAASRIRVSSATTSEPSAPRSAAAEATRTRAPSGIEANSESNTRTRSPPAISAPCWAEAKVPLSLLEMWTE